MEIGRLKGEFDKRRLDWNDLWWHYVSRGYEFRVCKRGKNKDSFGKKQYFFSNCWSDSSATRIFPAAM